MPGAPPPPPPPPPPPTPSGGPNLKLIVLSVIGLVVLAAAAVAAYALIGLGGNTTSAPPENSPAVEEASPSPSPSASLSPNQQVAQLESKGAADPAATGEAARSTAGGRFVLAVSAQLPDPPAGSFYEVFLVRPDSKSEFSAGRLVQIGDRWVMTLDQARDASAYSKVLVTRETKDDGTPETTVLSGEF